MVLSLFPAAYLPGLPPIVKRGIRPRSSPTVAGWEDYYLLSSAPALLQDQEFQEAGSGNRLSSAFFLPGPHSEWEVASGCTRFFQAHFSVPL